MLTLTKKEWDRLKRLDRTLQRGSLKWAVMLNKETQGTELVPVKVGT